MEYGNVGAYFVQHSEILWMVKKDEDGISNAFHSARGDEATIFVKDSPVAGSAVWL
jgi:hypothetical protein